MNCCAAFFLLQNKQNGTFFGEMKIKPMRKTFFTNTLQIKNQNLPRSRFLVTARMIKIHIHTYKEFHAKMQKFGSPFFFLFYYHTKKNCKGKLMNKENYNGQGRKFFG